MNRDLEPTPTENVLPLRRGDFSSLAEALDYAAHGETGCNFYSGKGSLYARVRYADLRREAQKLACRLAGLGLERGTRLALVADTTPEFLRFFFACQYAGLVAVPLPIAIHLGSHEAYVSQLRRLLISCQASLASAPPEVFPYLQEAAEGIDLHLIGTPETFDRLPEAHSLPSPLQASELAYLQYTSGSTRFPRGVMITQQAVMNNLASIIKDGLQVRLGDRCMSWLPFYHDMGLVGFVLGPLASQLSVDYLGTRDFAMRPRQWLRLLSRNRSTISFSPSFGYELCARRVRQDELETFDLKAWRVAGVGAETINADSLKQFARTVADSGFDEKAFVACYGMAECSLAVSFAPLDKGLEVDYVDGDRMAEQQQASPLEGPSLNGEITRKSSFVDCGRPLPGYQVMVRGSQGEELPDRHCGTIFVRSPSVMIGYFADRASTSEVLSADGWLDTGDLGYQVNGSLVITGRKKDLIIINGRNIWPQDLEWLAEQQPEVRPGDVTAFSAPGEHGVETAIMVIQCREMSGAKRKNLVERVQALVQAEFGISCNIELIPPHTLPRTSSGKLSRSRARQDFLRRCERVQPDKMRAAPD